MRRRRVGRVALVLLGLWALWPAPPAPVVVAAVAPADRVEEACLQPGDGPPAPVTETGDPTDAHGLTRDAALPAAIASPCPMPHEVVSLQPTGTLLLDEPDGHVFEAVRFEGANLIVPLRPGTTSAMLYLEGYSATALTWVDGRCSVGPLTAKATVSGQIRPTAGAAEGAVAVQGCGANAPVDHLGGFFAEIEPRPCTLFAVRRDGALVVRSAPVELDPRPGQDLVVDLELPEWRAASVGVELQLDEEGRVFVHAVDPAVHALRPGDRVLAIDGVALDGMDLWSVSDLAIGPDDAEAVLVIDRDGMKEEHTLRRFVPPER